MSKETFEFYAAFIIGAALILAALLFSFQTTDGFVLVKSVVGQFGLIALFTIYILYIIYRRHIRFVFYQSYWPLIVYLLAVLISLSVAINPHLALNKTVEIVLWLLFFILLSQKKLTRQRLAYVAMALCLGGGIIAALGILTRAGYILSSEEFEVAMTTLGSHGVTANWLAPLIPLSLALASINGKKLLGGLTFLCLVLMKIGRGHV